MAAKALLLSGIAAFGIGLVAAGTLFHEPGGGDRHHRRSPPPAAAAEPSWEGWRPYAPEPAAALPEAEPQPTDQPLLDFTFSDADYDPNAVWATPAEWSDVE